MKSKGLISDELIKKLNNFKPDIATVNAGSVLVSKDGILIIDGLKDAKYGELLYLGGESYAIALNLETDTVGAILLTDPSKVAAEDIVYTTGKIVSIPVGDMMLGRVVNPLGEGLDGKRVIKSNKYRNIESPAPGIMDRAKVKQPLMTGLLSIDSMIPIGKGQRELIIGDRQTGKTAIAVDAIINQRGKNVICVYVSIGQKTSNVAQLVHTLTEHNAMSYTVIVASTADDPSPLQYIAPYAGCAIAEEFMYSGRDVLIIYDDLTKHAVAYRAISLLLRRPPGREAYPGDIFYIHSRLLERASKLSDALGGGSMTALPIIETQAGDISAYIPTNVISITDGQIYLEGELFNSGFRPAVNVGLSVSRVGGAAQTKAMRKVSGRMRLDLAHYRELSVFAQFGADLDKNTKEVLRRGELMTEALKQAQYSPMSMPEQVVQLYAASSPIIKEITAKDIQPFMKGLHLLIQSYYPDIISEISNGTLEPATTEKLDKAISSHLK